ncbi:MAG: LacI family transcriptional regulator [Actinomycetia bacterium]|nr:LacI family transcriptional regulator [Actinomycetes bacterium]
MEDVAERAGVSRALVSLVMRDSPKVSEKSREAVLKAAGQIGYRPNLMARSLASQRTMTIGLVLNDLHNPFFAELADGVHNAAVDAGYRVVINSGFGTAEGESGAAATFLEYRVDGLIMAGPVLSDSQIEDIGAETRLVLIAREIPTRTVDMVTNDDAIGAQLAIDHLVSLGHTEIAHVDGGVGAGAAGRRAGYVQAMKAHGLDRSVRIVPGDFTESSGAAAIDRLVGHDSPPTAVFVANDLSATGALHRLEQLGLSLPEDISLVGYDNTALAALGHIALTTVNQPRELMGGLAVKMLTDRIESGGEAGTHEVIAPTLVVRSTTGPAL